MPGFAYASGLTGIWTAIGCVAGLVAIVTTWLIMGSEKIGNKNYRWLTTAVCPVCSADGNDNCKLI